MTVRNEPTARFLWDFLRNDALQKFQPRFHTKTPLKQNQFASSWRSVLLPKITMAQPHVLACPAITRAARYGSYGVTQMPTAAESRRLPARGRAAIRSG